MGLILLDSTVIVGLSGHQMARTVAWPYSDPGGAIQTLSKCSTSRV